ncbi:glucan biosynthesis protein [Horticoccus luteus]|uniref:Glucan biosynthesis protein n=1 Tax=Horticoccus luteus TaxID=2862869 RepID=A0A8F9TRI7_9BACT|nr:glucan biosynthesis protein [Horticoccus luteus]QYM77671.1 glucan biosynthesis protein [Horticoccus luteus]
MNWLTRGLWCLGLAGVLSALAAPAFDFEVVEARAKALASHAYVAPAATLPISLEKLSYDEYRRIRFVDGATWWRAEKLPFQLQFFHLGLFYHEAVVINEVRDGVARPIPFSKNMFDYDRLPLGNLPASLGFAGFRILYPLNKARDEVGAFLGASYFRMLCRGAHYGLSARGLALNAGGPGPEEFPRFSEFWIEQPAPESSTLVLYALLDSPSVAGAYRFELTPGDETLVDVHAVVYARKNVAGLGVAPLTSMFWHAENTERPRGDFRPEVHDSDGLLLHLSSGEWLWRPLTNPAAVQVASFNDTALRGFGLLQRDRSFASYEDLEAYYHARPSVWIEPKGEWGKGAVRLLEIPTQQEVDDNVVAFWVPAKALKRGDVIDLHYRMHWTLNAVEPPGGKAIATRLAGVEGNRAARRFLVDFAGGDLDKAAPDAQIESVVTVVTGGKLAEPATIQRNAFNATWRTAFVVTPDAPDRPVELRCYLRSGTHVLSETWSYLWNP